MVTWGNPILGDLHVYMLYLHIPYIYIYMYNYIYIYISIQHIHTTYIHIYCLYVCIYIYIHSKCIYLCKWCTYKCIDDMPMWTRKSINVHFIRLCVNRDGTAEGGRYYSNPETASHMIFLELTLPRIAMEHSQKRLHAQRFLEALLVFDGCDTTLAWEHGQKWQHCFPVCSKVARVPCGLPLGGDLIRWQKTRLCDQAIALHISVEYNRIYIYIYVIIG